MELVLDAAEDRLENVLERDEADHGVELVGDQRQMRQPAPEATEHYLGGFVATDHRHLAQQRPQIGQWLLVELGGQQIADMKPTDIAIILTAVATGVARKRSEKRGGGK